MQMGTIEKSKVVVYTDIHENDVDLTIKKKEKAFTKHVLEHTKKAFYPAFDASCHEFRDPKVLSQELNKFLERAKKRGFELLKICPFRCDEGDE